MKFLKPSFPNIVNLIEDFGKNKRVIHFLIVTTFSQIKGFETKDFFRETGCLKTILFWVDETGVNFINVLRSRFLYEIFGAKTSNPKHGFVFLKSIQAQL